MSYLLWGNTPIIITGIDPSSIMEIGHENSLGPIPRRTFQTVSYTRHNDLWPPRFSKVCNPPTYVVNYSVKHSTRRLSL